MRNLILIFVLITIAFTSCEGRKSGTKALKDNIEKFKKHSKLDIEIYYPDNYREFKSDTILSNGYRVNITNFTNMTKSVVNVVKGDYETTKSCNRKIASKIIIYRNDIAVFNKTIDIDDINSYLNFKNNNTNFKNLRGVWLNQNQTYLSNTIVLDVEVINVKNKQNSKYHLRVDDIGDFEIIKTQDYI